MFKNTYQSGLLSIFYSCGSNPLAIWDMEVNNGHVKRITDQEVNSLVLEIVSTNVATTYITCPKSKQVLGIRLPFLVMIVKNLKRYFSFEITILDDKNMRRRFRISNFQSTTKIKPFCTTMPIGLSGGWNQIQFNLSDFTKRAYGSQFIETLRVQVHANARLRRIYFSDRLYTEEELPQEYKLYLPLERKLKKKEAEAAKPLEGAPPGAPTETPTEAAPAKSTVTMEKSKVGMAKSTVGMAKSTVGIAKSAVAVTPEAEGEEAAVTAEGETPAEGAEEEAPKGGEAPTAEGSEAAPEGEGAAPAEGEAEAALAEGEVLPEAAMEASPEGGETAEADAAAEPAAEAPAEEPEAPPAE